jgi:integrase
MAASHGIALECLAFAFRSDSGPYTLWDMVFRLLAVSETLSSVLSSAVQYELLTKNPMLAVQIPRTKILNRKKKKPYITPEEFHQLIASIAEPYATMIYVAVHTGLRVSELAGLKWEDVRDDSLTIDERYCRGDWSITKTEQSSNTISVAPVAIDRIRRLKTLEVELKWGGKGARKQVKVVRADGPQDLVFQGVRKGGPLQDGNVRLRHLRPAAVRLGIDGKKATWQALRRSYGTWMSEAGANVKDVQAQMRHSRISTTMDIYAQCVPESQHRAVAKMRRWWNRGRNRRT